MAVKRYRVDASNCTLEQHRNIIHFLNGVCVLPVHVPDHVRVYDVFWEDCEPIDEAICKAVGACLVSTEYIYHVNQL